MKKWMSLAVATLLAGSLGLAGCNLPSGDETGNKVLTVYAPDGAPALAVAGLAVEGYTLEYDGQSVELDCKIVSSTVISTKVTNKDMGANADFCVLPVTAGSKLLGSGEKYGLLGAVTHGNLYLVSKDSESVYKVETVSSLVGKTIGVLQINEVPGLVLKTALDKHGLAWQELKNDTAVDATKVNLVGISGPADMGVIEADCYLLGEPAVSAQKGKGYSIVGSLQEIYGGENGYPQAVLVGKKTILADTALVKAFAKAVAESTAWLASAEGAEIVSRVTASLEDENYATTLKAPLLTAEVLARCSVRFAQAKDCKGAVEAFLRDAGNVNPQMAVLPQEAFYYMQDLGV